MSSECLKIKKIEGSGHSYLKLEGTVLIYNQKNWFFESKLMIPIESINISEHSRFYKDMLILAVLILLLPILIGTFMYFYGFTNFYDLQDMLFPIICVIIFLEFWMLFALVFNFMFTKKTVCLTIGNTGIKIEFWKKRKENQRIDLFLDKIREKQFQLKSSFTQHLEEVFEIRNIDPLRRLIPLCCMFCLPSELFQKPILLLLGLIPIIQYLYESLKLLKQPKEFKQAFKNYRKKRWDKAIEHLTHLHEQIPEYIPAIYLLIETYLNSEKFDEALSFVSKIPEKYLQDINALHLNIWKWKRIHMRRIESS